jgi:hypothetical protein
MPYIGTYIWMVALFGCSFVALVGGAVVAELTEDLAFGVIAGVAGLVLGLVVGYVMAGFGEATLGEHPPPYAVGTGMPTAVAILVFAAIFLAAPVIALLTISVVGWHLKELLGG